MKLQLSMVTHERDNLKNIVNELKETKNNEVGNQEVGGNTKLVQVDICL